MPARFWILIPLAACASGQPAPAAPPVPVPAPAPAPPPFGELNLGFEAETLAPWMTRVEGASLDDKEPHAGRRALRIARQDPNGFTPVANQLPIEQARGKRVRISAWLRTDGAGGAFIWLRADGDSQAVAFQNTQANPVAGTSPWTQREAVIDVPADAKAVFFGAGYAGAGTAWADDFAVTLAPISRFAIVGVVRDPGGKPVAGAAVALVPAGGWTVAETAHTEPDGQFSFDAPPGRYTITASTPSGWAKLSPDTDQPGAAPIDVTLKPGPIARGRLDAGGSVPKDTQLLAMRFDRRGVDVFVFDVAPDGTFAASLPALDFWVGVRGASLASRGAILDGKAQEVVLTATARGTAPEETVAWVRDHAIPLDTADPEHGPDDLRPLKKIVGDARVVALGEATHGTREFFQLKHRVLELLVAEMGFTVFTIEANWPESLAVNEYVLTGAGDPKKALAGLYFWTWNTEEVLALIEWMRRWNADPKHKRKVKFLGFDMQTSQVAVANVRAFLRRVDPAAAAEVEDALKLLDDATPRDLTPEQERAARAGAAALVARFDREQRRWTAKSSAADWRLARQNAVILRQDADLTEDMAGSLGVRDRAMADNLRWILDTQPRGTKVVVWAHNGHVGKDAPTGWDIMGSHLARALGASYFVIGFAFSQGGFQAMDGSGKRGLSAFTVGPARPGDIGEAFARTGLPLFALDLRRLADDAAATKWLRDLRPMREIGAVFTNDDELEIGVILPASYDAVIFVDRTSRARPVRP